MAKSSNGNVKMIITEEKILANIEKIKKWLTQTARNK